jgi:hypothetical protein
MEKVGEGMGCSFSGACVRGREEKRRRRPTVGCAWGREKVVKIWLQFAAWMHAIEVK